MLTIRSDNWQTFFFDAKWWQQAFQTALKFAPHCLPGAVAFTLSNLVVVISTAWLETTLRSMQGATITDITGLMVGGILGLIGSVGALAASLWSLSFWLMRLTAFALVVKRDTGAVGKEELKAAIAETQQRNGFIVKVWVVASLYLLLPLLPLSLLLSVRVLWGAAHPLFAADILPMPAWYAGTTGRLAVEAGIALLTIVILAYSFITMAFSADSHMPPGRTATAAARETLRQLPVVLSITTIIFLANIVLTAPQMLVSLTSWSTVVQHPVAQAIEQIWLGLTSLVIWPLSVAPYCKLVHRAEEAANG